MIFATVGTQLPFPRFVDALDRIARAANLEIVAQTCEPAKGRRNITEHSVLDAATFEGYASRADMIVGHAGIGTLLTARRVCKPVILFPRRASLGEHRNEHQLATVRAIGDRAGIYVAYNEDELAALLGTPELAPLRSGESPAREALIAKLREFIAG